MSFEDYVMQYYENYASQTSAWGAMETDHENGNTPDCFNRDMTHYLIKVQDRIDEACCAFIFGRAKS
jgi:hypothetical protein